MAQSSNTKATTFYTQSGTDKAIAAAIAGTKPPYLSGYATKTDLASGLSTRAEIAALSAVKAVADAALPKEEAASTYATASALQAVRKTAEDAAAASGSLDMSGFLKKDDAAATYQVRGEYALKSDVPDVSGLATRDDVVSGLEGKADRADVPDVSGYETAAHAAETYQPKGEYALASDLETKADASALATKANASSLAAVKSTADAALSKDEAVSTYATLASVEAVKETAGAALPKSDAASTYAKASELAAVKKTADAAAPASAIPDVSGLISKTDADKAYQAKGDYATHADVTQAVANAATSGTVNLSGYATTGDLDAVRAVADSALTPAEADKAYQPKGDYATASSVSDALNSKADVSAIPDVSDFVTKSDADTKYQGKGSYATTSDLSLKADASALDSYETSAHAAAAYQPKGSYALKTDVPDVSGLATTTALTEGLAGKVDSTALASYETVAHAQETYQPKGDYVTAAAVDQKVSAAASGLATADALMDGLAAKADKSEVPDVSGFQPKGDYATTAVVDQKIAAIPATDLSGYVQDADLDVYAKKTDIPDVSGLAEKSALAAKADVSAIPDVSGLATKAEVTSGLAAKADASALSGYQPKGDYALRSDVPDVSGLAKGDTGVGVVSILDEDRDGVATVTLTDGTTSSLPLPTAATPRFTAEASALAAGAAPTADVTGTYPDLTIALGVPEGAPGQDAVSPAFTASASTLAAGASATADVTGTYPAMNLTFGLPRGATGAKGDPGAVPTASDYLIVAAGRPDVSSSMATTIATAVAAAPVGCEFRSTDGPQGAWRWQRIASTGIATTDWVVTVGDTGWFSIKFADNSTNYSNMMLKERITPNVTYLDWQATVVNATLNWQVIMDPAPLAVFPRRMSGMLENRSAGFYIPGTAAPVMWATRVSTDKRSVGVAISTMSANSNFPAGTIIGGHAVASNDFTSWPTSASLGVATTAPNLTGPNATA